MPTRPHNAVRARVANTPGIRSAERSRTGLESGPVRQDALTWRFERASDGRWQWHRIDLNHRLTRESGRSFATYEACADDAATAGYKPLLQADHLVPLSLSHEAAPIPRVLALDLDEVSPAHAGRSSVLKKRVAHPSIERIFGKRRMPAVTRTRRAVLARTSGPQSAGKHPQSRVKKLKRA